MYTVQHVREKDALHTGSHLLRRMPSRSVSGCTGRHGFRTKRTRQRLTMEIVSCSAPSARTVSTNADLHALLEAAGRINYHVFALQETKSRKTNEAAE
ncbi:unnamed protein product [Strongylus vulgaris]|uniref:Uncharacterized protein n=1 Tax=Strongylus vulgaris TaxID=40348 RepID=A0A3P7J079_STRVU|nr:unnamed protein product [Strongylus vulgaris]